MQDKTMDREVSAALRRLEQEDPGIRQLLDDSYAYAVFPSVGKAALVVGGAYGHGLVFERGKPTGHATLAQTTLGVQIGGDTFTEVIAFDSRESLDRFKEGKVVFAANASAVLVKAGAAGTADYEDGVCALAYSQGGMLLEAAIGGQKFNFKPLEEDGASGGSRRSTGGSSRKGGAKSRSSNHARSAKSRSSHGRRAKSRSSSHGRGKKTKARRTAGKSRRSSRKTATRSTSRKSHRAKARSRKR